MNDSIDPDGVEINTDEVAKTGRETFPAVAGKFRMASTLVISAQNDVAKGMAGSGILSSWSEFNSLTNLFIETSANHLDACGDVLEQVANDHAWTDEDNKYRITEVYYSSHEEAVFGK